VRRRRDVRLDLGCGLAGRRSGGPNIRSLGDPALCFEANDNTRPEGGQVQDPDQEGTVDEGYQSTIDEVTRCPGR
jgi:hypothetical protein